MLDIDLVTILAEILNFLVLSIALYFLLFKPIVKRMEQSAKKRAELLTSAQEKEEQVSEKLAIIEERLANIDNEIEARIQIAQQQTQTESEVLLEATQKEAENILIEAEKEAVKFQQQEIEKFQEQLVDAILQISGQILQKKSPAVIHDNLLEELVQEIWDLGKSDMRRVKTIRDSLAERIPTVNVISARELTPDQQRSLIRTFSALADRNINMEIEIDPDIISGIRVRIGDLVVENSLAMDLSELKSEVAETLEEGIGDDE
ncbi:MAG: F0F1 ATP synthase subunit delta [Brevefilum sp.]|nr:F0F1 ATP synthase subunit delta [Brevefilum sp.]